MQRLIAEIWISLAIAAGLGAVAAWAVMRLWVGKILARRDQVTMARLKAADESWTERVWAAEEERDAATARMQVMDTRLARALEHADALEMQIRSVGAEPVRAAAERTKAALTVRIRSVGEDGRDEVAEAPVEIGTLPAQSPAGRRAGSAEEARIPDPADSAGNGVARTEEPFSRPAGPSAPRAARPPRPGNGQDDAPAGETDDLTRIEGVGFGYAARLNALGYWRFEQIAQWTVHDVQRVAGALGTTVARIHESDWINQARALQASKV